MLFRLVNLKLFNMNRKYYLLVIFAFILSCEKDDDHDHDHDSEVFGCMDETATNYNSLATEDDGSCVYGDIEGCTDETASNYNEYATIDDGSCVYEDSFDKSLMLTNWVDNIIIPAHNEFNSKLSELNSAINSFVSSPSISSLQNASDAWLLAYKYWQHIEMFDFGTAEVINYKNKMNVYPTDVDLINSNISNGGYDLNNNNNFDARGFPAIDYMLHGLAENNEEIINQFNSNQSFANYLISIVDNMIYNTNLVLDYWSINRENFISNDGNTATSSINKITNDFIYFFEKGLRANKIGIPAGRYSSDPLPQNVEAYYKQDVSKELALEALLASKNFFVGNHFNQTITSGFSFKDYLEDLDNSILVELIMAQFSDAEAQVNQLDNNFVNQILKNNNQMLYAFDYIQFLVVSFKVDMLQSLGISVDYIDADGD